MLAVAQQSEPYFNMAAKDQRIINDLSIDLDTVREAVLADMDDLSSQELEEIDEEESVNGESEDVVSEKTEL